MIKILMAIGVPLVLKENLILITDSFIQANTAIEPQDPSAPKLQK